MLTIDADRPGTSERDHQRGPECETKTWKYRNRHPRSAVLSTAGLAAPVHPHHGSDILVAATAHLGPPYRRRTLPDRWGGAGLEPGQLDLVEEQVVRRTTLRHVRRPHLALQSLHGTRVRWYRTAVPADVRRGLF